MPISINDLVVEAVNDTDSETTKGYSQKRTIVLLKKGVRVTLTRSDISPWPYKAGEKVSIRLLDSNTRVTDFKGAKK